MKYSPSLPIYVSLSHTDNHCLGRGVFAKEEIRNGTIIEECPLIEIPEHEFENFSSSILLEYLFFGTKCAFLALGFGSLYNHTSTPNAQYTIKETEKVLEISALKDIKKDEEIMFNYKGDSTLPLWFEL